MKKFLCAILAIGMLCSVTAFIGCGKKSVGSVSSQSKSNIYNDENDNMQEAPGEWNDDWN